MNMLRVNENEAYMQNFLNFRETSFFVSYLAWYTVIFAQEVELHSKEY